LDWNGIWTGVGILAPCGVGVLVGIFAIAKLVEIIFEKCPLYAYWAIIGLIVASPIAIVLMNLAAFTAGTVLLYLAGVVCLALGVFAAMKLGE
jgi:putative membrane protein